MKNLHFNRKTALLRNMAEEPVAKKKTDWDKIVYFLVVILAIFFLGRFLINKLFYVHAQGQVLFNSIKVRVPDDIIIKQFAVTEGDTVQVGDTLFAYTVDDDTDGGYGGVVMLGARTQPGRSWQEREVYNLNKRIRMDRLQISENEKMIEWYKKQVKVLRNQVILEVSSKTKIDTYLGQVEKLSLENQKLHTEISLFETMIGELDGAVYSDTSKPVSASGYNVFGSGSVPRKQYFVSPMNGVVTRIYKRENEVALKTEEIMNVHQKKNIYVKAFFDLEDSDAISVGDEVSVIFPNGDQSKGIIKRFYNATYKLPPEFQQKYDPITRSIAADVLPLDSIDLSNWLKFYKISVQIEKSKYQW